MASSCDGCRLIGLLKKRGLGSFISISSGSFSDRTRCLMANISTKQPPIFSLRLSSSSSVMVV